MVGLTPQMRAALETTDPICVALLEVRLPNYNLRVIDGASEVVWPNLDGAAATFVGRDPTYGVWSASDAFGDGIGDQVPAMGFTLLPTDVANAASLTDPKVQTSRTRVWFAVIDKTTGGLVPDPYQLFEGELDQPTLTVGKGTLELEYTVASAFERLFLNSEGNRLSDAFHQLRWPGELGLQYMTGLVRQIIWGPGDRPSGITSANGGGGYSSSVAIGGNRATVAA